MNKGNTIDRKRQGPKAGSPTDKIVRKLHVCGPQQYESLLYLFNPESNHSSRRAAMIRAAMFGWLEEEAGIVSLTPAMRAVLDAERPDAPAYVGQIVAPQYRPDFRPMTADPFASVRDKLRRVSFVSCNSTRGAFA